MKEINVEISVDEFRKLSEGSGSGGSSGIVDWDKVLGEIDGRVVSFNSMKKKVMSDYGKLLNYSEWTGVLERREAKGRIRVESKKLLSGGRRKRFWIVSNIEEEEEEKAVDVEE